MSEPIRRERAVRLELAELRPECGIVWFTNADNGMHRLEHWCAKPSGHSTPCRCGCGMPAPA